MSIKLTARNIDEWHKAMLKLKDKGIPQMKDRILRTAGLRALEILDDNTPVKTGRLKASMTMGGTGNIFELKVGKSSYVLVGSAVEYVGAVNDGYTQKKGRFVPGVWRGDTFEYIPGAKTGMVLTGKVIPGAHMFEAAIEGLKQDLPDIVEFEFRRTYADIFG